MVTVHIVEGGGLMLDRANSGQRGVICWTQFYRIEGIFELRGRAAEKEGEGGRRDRAGEGPATDIAVFYGKRYIRQVVLSM